MNFSPDIASIFNPKSIGHLIFFLAALFTLVTSGILMFHWKKYGVGGGVTLALTEVTYLIVVVALLATAYISLN